jgi:outer membrane receptor protein involved in Fe transport
VRLHQHFLLAPALVADAGADVVNYGGRARNLLTRVDFGAHGETSAAGFGRLHWSGNERIRFNAGLRYERSTIFGGIIAPEFGAGLRLKPGYAVHIGAARGFRNPTIRELYLFPAPNPDLKPEQAWMYQASLQMQPSGTFAASLTGYYADLSNLVVVTGRFPNLALRNTGAAINRGVESSVRWRAGKRVALHGGYAWLRSTNLPPFLPRHKATLGCELDLRRAWLSVNGVLVGRRWADAQRRSELDGYGVHGLKLMVPVGARWVLFGVLENFTHERYEVVTGYPMPGIHASGGFTLRF